MKYTDFITDIEKMRDFFKISKEEFLMSYSYLDEVEYNLTAEKINSMTISEVEKMMYQCEVIVPFIINKINILISIWNFW